MSGSIHARGVLRYDALIGIELDDVLEGAVPIPVVEPVDRETQIVDIAPLSPEERESVVLEHERDVYREKYQLAQTPSRFHDGAWLLPVYVRLVTDGRKERVQR